MPVLHHGTFDLYETAAICSYVDDVFAASRLQPKDPERRARCRQAIAIADQYAYRPMVRQVFGEAVFSPHGDQDQMRAGITAAAPVLDALDQLIADGRVLDGRELTLADLHVAPMLDYFDRAVAGRVAIQAYPRLGTWLAGMRERPAFARTDPGSPER